MDYSGQPKITSYLLSCIEFPSRWPCITDGFNDKTATLMLSWKDARSILDNCYELQHLSLITSDLDVTEYFYQNDYESLKKLCWKSRRIPVSILYLVMLFVQKILKTLID